MTSEQHGPIEALGYLMLEVSDLAAWRRMLVELLGLQPVERADGGLDLRMDQQAWRLRLVPGAADDIAVAGWQVQGPAALAALAGRLQAVGCAVEADSPELAADRQVGGLIRFTDPGGNVHEAYWGPLQRSEAPFASPLGVQFRTGAQGLGHIVLKAADKPAMMAFWTDVVGFRLSDHIRAEIVPGRPVELSFLRCNGRHHSLALAPVPVPRRLVHLMLEYTALDDVGHALDRFLEAGVHLSFTLGRHSNDRMLSFYPLTPSGFDIEVGWGGLEVDEANWRVETHAAMSAWGHRFQRPPKPSVA
jgi:2,3-dihydroxybiphenyl 1,2-dioxygenase